MQSAQMTRTSLVLRMMVPHLGHTHRQVLLFALGLSLIHIYKAIHIVANVQHQRIKQELGVAHKQHEQDQPQRQRNVEFR